MSMMFVPDSGATFLVAVDSGNTASVTYVEKTL